MGDSHIRGVRTSARRKLRSKDVCRVEFLLAFQSQWPVCPSEFLSIGINGELLAVVPRIGDGEEHVGGTGVLGNVYVFHDAFLEWWLGELCPILDLAADARSVLTASTVESVLGCISAEDFDVRVQGP